MPTALPKLNDQAWLKSLELQAIFDAIEGSGHEARVAGGAVRNALLGRAVKDVDIATTATPDETIAAARKAGLASFATGIAHGTVTLVSNHTPFEVTTLRRDVETDGRHARVVFTSDWQADASRRDFTINALYCDRHGTVFDPLNGFSDLEERRVQFIGSPRERIEEDTLRILRFFRFTAEYADSDPDDAGLKASAELKDAIAKLSGERRRGEILRMFEAPRASAMAAIMERHGILKMALGTTTDARRLTRLADIETAGGAKADALLRLAIISLLNVGDAARLRDSLKLSSADYERLALLELPDRAFDPAASEIDAKAFIYRHSARAFSDGVMLAWARSGGTSDDSERLHRLTLTQRWQVPELPVRGADVLALGVTAGPEVGRILSDFEDWWIAADFPMMPALIAKRLQHTIGVTKS